jgi:hypothetical protein
MPSIIPSSLHPPVPSPFLLGMYVSHIRTYPRLLSSHPIIRPKHRLALFTFPTGSHPSWSLVPLLVGGTIGWRRNENPLSLDHIYYSRGSLPAVYECMYSLHMRDFGTAIVRVADCGSNVYYRPHLSVGCGGPNNHSSSF